MNVPVPSAGLANRARMVARLSETWFRRPASPTRVVFDVTRRCNLRCGMCQTWKHDGADELSVPEIADILRQLPRLCWLDLTGGEPMLRKDAAELFAAVAENTPRLVVLHFPTNGSFTRRTVEICTDFVARRPEVELIVTVSIDGPPAVHDRIRGQTGAFARAIETFAALRALDRVAVFVGTTLTPDSEPHLDALAAELHSRFPDFDAREWHWNRLQVSEHFFANGRLADVAASRRSSIDEHVRRRGLPRGFVDLMELGFLINAEFVDPGSRRRSLVSPSARPRSSAPRASSTPATCGIDRWGPCASIRSRSCGARTRSGSLAVKSSGSSAAAASRPARPILPSRGPRSAPRSRPSGEA